MNKINVLFAILNNKEMLLKSFKISLIVGSLLNIINQGELIFALDFDNINYVKTLLTYGVPFMVSTYTAMSMKLKFKIGDITHIDTTLKCSGCNEVIQIHKNDIVPVCSKCKEKTKWRIK